MTHVGESKHGARLHIHAKHGCLPLRIGLGGIVIVPVCVFPDPEIYDTVAGPRVEVTLLRCRFVGGEVEFVSWRARTPKDVCSAASRNSLES